LFDKNQSQLAAFELQLKRSSGFIFQNPPSLRGHSMKFSHVVLWIDHQQAKLIHFNATDHSVEIIRATEEREQLHTRSGTFGDGRAKIHADYFKDVSTALASSEEILVVGPGLGKNEFISFLEKKLPLLRAKVLGVESSDHPSDGQLLALAKTWFKGIDLMRGTELPK
jgi:hypothetical protein